MLAYVDGGESVLFDRRNDPDQVSNLFAEPGYEDVVQDLTERIVQHHEALGSPAAAWLGAGLDTAATQ
jgi:hypothetical protein